MDYYNTHVENIFKGFQEPYTISKIAANVLNSKLIDCVNNSYYYDDTLEQYIHRFSEKAQEVQNEYITGILKEYCNGQEKSPDKIIAAEMDYAIRIGGILNIEEIVTDELKRTEGDDSSYREDLKLIKDNISDYKKYFGHFTNIELDRPLYLTTMMYLDEDKIHIIEENIGTNFSKEIDNEVYVKNFEYDDESKELLSNVLDCIIEKNLIQPELLHSIICKTGNVPINFFRLEEDSLTSIEAGNLIGLNDFKNEDICFTEKFFPYYREEHGIVGDIEESVENELKLTGCFKYLSCCNCDEDEYFYDYYLEEYENEDYVKLNEIGNSVSPIISNYTKEDFEMYKNSPYYDDSMRLDDEKMPEIMEQVYEYHVEQAKNSLKKAENLKARLNNPSYKELENKAKDIIGDIAPHQEENNTNIQQHNGSVKLKM